MLINFSGKHSKDHFLSLYLNKRVFVDDGEPESVTGVLRINPDQIVNLPSELGVFCRLICSYVYEVIGPKKTLGNLSKIQMPDTVDSTLLERTLEIYPNNESVTEVI